MGVGYWCMVDTTPVGVFVRMLESEGYCIQREENGTLRVKLNINGSINNESLNLQEVGTQLYQIDHVECKDVYDLTHPYGRKKLLKQINWMMPTDLLLVVREFPSDDYIMVWTFVDHEYTRIYIRSVHQYFPVVRISWDINSENLESGCLEIKYKPSNDSEWVKVWYQVVEKEGFTVFTRPNTNLPAINQILDLMHLWVDAPDNSTTSGHKVSGTTLEERKQMLLMDTSFNPTTFQCIQALHARVCDLEEVKKGNT